VRITAIQNRKSKIQKSMQTLHLTIENDPLIVDQYGAHGDATPVLLLHGWGGSGRYWRPTVERLRNHWNLIVPDLPGVGRSLPVRRARTIVDLAAAVEQMVDRLELRRLHVVGHSMGGGIALLLAARRPHLIDRLVLTGLSLFRNDGERALFNTFAGVMGLMLRARAPWMARVPLLARAFARRFFYRVPDDPETLRAGLEDYLHMDYATAVASARSSTSPAIVTAAGRIAVPTLLVAARQDQIMPVANVPFTSATIPGCEVHWIENCGHLPMVEKADEYAQILNGFLRRAAFT
jgi:pimeloyl-ACP methyl ester carboxylesterase